MYISSSYNPVKSIKAPYRNESIPMNISSRAEHEVVSKACPIVEKNQGA